MLVLRSEDGRHDGGGVVMMRMMMMMVGTYISHTLKNIFTDNIFILGQETPADEKLPLEVLSKFNGKTREVYNLQHIKKITKLLNSGLDKNHCKSTKCSGCSRKENYRFGKLH